MNVLTDCRMLAAIKSDLSPMLNLSKPETYVRIHLAV